MKLRVSLPVVLSLLVAVLAVCSFLPSNVDGKALGFASSSDPTTPILFYASVAEVIAQHGNSPWTNTVYQCSANWYNNVVYPAGTDHYDGEDFTFPAGSSAKICVTCVGGGTSSGNSADVQDCVNAFQQIYGGNNFWSSSNSSVATPSPTPSPTPATSTTTANKKTLAQGVARRLLSSSQTESDLVQPGSFRKLQQIYDNGQASCGCAAGGSTMEYNSAQGCSKHCCTIASHNYC